MKKLGCMLMAVLMAVAVSGCSDKKEASEKQGNRKKGNTDSGLSSKHQSYRFLCGEGKRLFQGRRLGCGYH